MPGTHEGRPPRRRARFTRRETTPQNERPTRDTTQPRRTSTPAARTHPPEPQQPNEPAPPTQPPPHQTARRPRDPAARPNPTATRGTDPTQPQEAPQATSGTDFPAPTHASPHTHDRRTPPRHPPEPSPAPKPPRQGKKERPQDTSERKETRDDRPTPAGHLWRYTRTKRSGYETFPAAAGASASGRKEGLGAPGGGLGRRRLPARLGRRRGEATCLARLINARRKRRQGGWLDDPDMIYVTVLSPKA